MRKKEKREGKEGKWEWGGRFVVASQHVSRQQPPCRSAAGQRRAQAQFSRFAWVAGMAFFFLFFFF